jgi:hypothetical protein
VTLEPSLKLQHLGFSLAPSNFKGGRVTWYLQVSPKVVNKQLEALREIDVDVELWFGSFSKGISEAAVRQLIERSQGVFFQQFPPQIKFIFEEKNTLKSLWIGDDAKPPKADLRLWPRLNSLSASFDQVSYLETAVGLKELILWGKLPADYNFGAQPQLEIIKLVRNSLVDLKSMKLPTGLRVLNLAYMSTLVNLSGIEACGNSLEELNIHACAGLKDVSALSKCKKLRRLMLYAIPPLPSLDFTKNMNQLDFISFMGVDVLDGKISRLKKLPRLTYAAFTSKRHFDIKFGDLGTPENPMKPRT